MRKGEVRQQAEQEAELFFSAELELTRISKYTVRYRIIGHEGVKCPLHHIEFNRDEFPADDDFNMDFMLKDLGKDADKGVKAKQAEFRDYLNYDLVIR